MTIQKTVQPILKSWFLLEQTKVHINIYIVSSLFRCLASSAACSSDTSATKQAWFEKGYLLHASYSFQRYKKNFLVLKSIVVHFKFQDLKIEEWVMNIGSVFGVVSVKEHEWFYKIFSTFSKLAQWSTFIPRYCHTYNRLMKWSPYTC